METVQDFAESYTGRRCTFKYFDFLSREGTYTGTVKGYYSSSFAFWILIEPDVNIGEKVSKAAGDTNFHWRESALTYLLVDLNKITISPIVSEAKKRWPHICYCGAPAQIVFNTVECSAWNCRNYKKNP